MGLGEHAGLGKGAVGDEAPRRLGRGCLDTHEAAADGLRIVVQYCPSVMEGHARVVVKVRLVGSDFSCRPPIPAVWTSQTAQYTAGLPYPLNSYMNSWPYTPSICSTNLPGPGPYARR